MDESITTETSTYTRRADGIIIQRIKPGIRQELKDAEENIAAFRRMAAGRKCALLVDLRETGPTGPGVREYYAKHTELLTATALLIGSSLGQIIGNFFLNLNRPVSPCRLFTSEAAALAWLRTHSVAPTTTV
jgi:hypothetical protein